MSKNQDRFEGMTNDLMHDLFEVLADADAVAAIIEAPAADEVLPAIEVEAQAPADEFGIELEGKTYTAASLSRSRTRNVLMLNTCLKVMLTPGANVEGARAMAHAILDALA